MKTKKLKKNPLKKQTKRLMQLPDFIMNVGTGQVMISTAKGLRS